MKRDLKKSLSNKGLMDMLEEIILPASDRTVLYMYCWRAENPRAVVLLAHGMTEHSMRYDRLGRFLAQQGISLYCHDQRGHGKTAAGRLGYLRKGLDLRSPYKGRQRR